jgi:hypothetical protein
MRSNLRIPLADVELDAWFYRPAVCLTATQLAAFNRAHEPKKLKLLHSGHYDVCWRKFDDAAEAACDWFQEHLITDQSPPAQGAALKAA